MYLFITSMTNTGNLKNLSPLKTTVGTVSISIRVTMTNSHSIGVHIKCKADGKNVSSAATIVVKSYIICCSPAEKHFICRRSLVKISA
jgi:hypothetical protein